MITKQKTLVVFAAIIIVVLVAATTASAASWSKRITGGMSRAVGYGEFTVTLSAWENADGTFGGQGQYCYTPIARTFHLRVEKVCAGIVPPGYSFAGQPYAVAIGSIFGQDGTTVSEGYGGISVAEGGTGSNDGVRVAFDETWETVNTWCETTYFNNYYYHWPAIVAEGNFNIRSK